ncbi:MAG: hypothetical protein P4M07_09910 [Xanthobacteraceae bacterium]|nr:hypothetical protein [Xanthobacteraceae bacterium]
MVDVAFSRAERREARNIMASFDHLTGIVGNLDLLLQRLDQAITTLPAGEGRDLLEDHRTAIVLSLYVARRAVIEAERFTRDSLSQ